MRKFTLLSLVLTVALALSMFLVACNGNTVSEHDHVWDDGTVTTEPTCHSEGLRTYSCTVDGCTQTKTEPIAMTQHNWDEGAVTEPSTCQSQGTKTYTCRNEGCTATKTEKLQKSSHNWDEGVLTEVPDFYTPGEKKYTCLTDGCGETRTESVGAHADFSEQYYFSLTDANNWSYGYVAGFDAASASYTFTQITQIDAQSNAWKADGVEISKGYIYSQKNAAVMYTFKEVVKKGIQANVAISFFGEDSATLVNAYLFVTHESSEPTKIDLNKNGAKDWTYASKEAYDLAQGDSFTVVFSNKGTGKASGKFTFTLTAPCNHVWGNATVDAATCTKPGTRQYTCLNDCGATMDEEIPATGHNWDNGEVTQEPTATEDGVKTFHCLNGCGETKTESIPKLAPFESANLVDDFNDVLSGENAAWQIGVVDFTDDTKFTFTPLTTKSTDAFTNGDPYMEIKGDWAAINGMAGIAYTFGADAKVDLSFSFTRNGNADFAIRWAIKNSSGKIISNDGNASWGGKTSDNGGTVTINETIDFHAGETIYILINHEDSDGDQCTYTYTLTKHSDGPIVPEAPFEGANLAGDFADVLSGENVAWQIGVVDFKSDAEFTLAPLTTKSTDAFTNGDPYMEIKGDWAAINRMAGIAYTFGADAKVDLNFSITRKNADDADFAIRWAVKNASGKIVSNDGRASWAGKISDSDKNGTVTINETIDFHAGDIIYILINHESGGDQCNYTYTLKKHSDEPVKAFAEFKKDFHDGDTTNNWEYGSSEYAWDTTKEIKIGNESFTYTKGTYNKDAQAWESGDASIKAGSVDIRNNATIVYTFGKDMTVNIYLTFKGEEGKTVHSALRMVIVDNDGKGVQKLETFGVGSNTKNEWTATFENVQVKANYKMYIIFFVEGDANDSSIAEFDCKFTSDQAQGGDEPVVPPTEGTTVTFNDEFAATLAGEDNGWSVGNVDYKFDPESFEYFKTDKKNDKGEAFVNVDDKPFFEIKGDWAAISDYAAIAYAFKGTGDAHFKFDITGIGNATFTVRYAVISASGTAKKGPEFAGNDAHVTLEADITVEAGDTLYIIINHENGGDDNQCNYTYTLTKHFDEAVVPGTPFDGANLADDFASTIGGNANGWAFGKVNYTFETETFEFTKIDANANKTAYISGENSMNGTGATVKDSMMGIAYTFESDAKVDIKFVLTCVGGAKFSVRWAIKNSAGAIINGANGKANWGGDTGDTGNYTLSQTVDVHTGDTLYILINHEDSDGNQCTYTYTLTKHSDGPIVPPTDATTVNFKDDFQATLDGEDNGWSVGNVDFDFGANTFVYSNTDKKNVGSDGFVNADDKTFFELKGDWAAIGNMAAIAYTFKEAGNVHFKFDITGIESATFSVRYAVVGGDGEVKTAPVFVDNNAHVTAEYDMAVEAGDTLYIIINHELGGEKNQCNFSLELNAKA